MEILLQKTGQKYSQRQEFRVLTLIRSTDLHMPCPFSRPTTFVLAQKLNLLLPCPSTLQVPCKIVCAGPNILCQTKTYLDILPFQNCLI